MRSSPGHLGLRAVPSAKVVPPRIAAKPWSFAGRTSPSDGPRVQLSARTRDTCPLLAESSAIAAPIWRHARCNASFRMTTMTVQEIERRGRRGQGEPLDYGFGPMRNARWYKRLAAWALSGTNRRYDAMVAEEKTALLSPLSGTVLEIGPGGGNNLAFLRPHMRWIGIEPNPFFHDRLRARGQRLGIDV